MSCSFPEFFPEINSAGNMASFGQPFCEHNIGCDPEAAEYVFSHKDDIVVVDWNLTLQQGLSKSEVARLLGE